MGPSPSPSSASSLKPKIENFSLAPEAWTPLVAPARLSFYDIDSPNKSLPKDKSALVSLSKARDLLR